jgi:hypothetical protein
VNLMPANENWDQLKATLKSIGLQDIPVASGVP